ncbi:MAG TPA: nucleotidyltransferase family protein [Armatimonadota bacterium]|nr:nucleotidyltransferase family protein [Armatimonadota bacterium]HPO73971.1 nucleotidyltransferase family protein [Armatimonadota bacterium]
MDEHLTNPRRDRAGATLAHALVLATNRVAAPLKEQTAISLRARLPVRGRPVLAWVLDALREASRIDSVVAVGPRSLAEEMGFPVGVRWVEEAETPAESVRRGLRGLGLSTPVVVIPADLALLTPELIDDLIASFPLGVDVGCPLIRVKEFTRAFPTLPQVTMNFRDGRFVGGRVVVAKPQAVVMNYGLLQRAWRRPRWPEAAIGMLGMQTALLYSLRLLSARQVAARATHRLMAPCAVLPDAPPELAFTLDTPEHFRLAQERQVAAPR